MKNKMVDKTCRECGNEFKVWESHSNRGDGVYCSRQCSALGRSSKRKYECPKCGMEFVPNKKHQVYCSNSCSALVKGDAYRTPFDERFFDRDDPVTAYWAGFLVADGSVQYRGGSCILSVCISKKDESHLLSFSSDIGYGAPPRQGTDGNGHLKIRVDLSSPKMKTGLERWGIKPRKTYIGNFPGDIRKDLLPHYIRGVIDGDGYICFGDGKRPRIEIVGNQEFLTGMSDAIWSQTDVMGKNSMMIENQNTGHRTYRLLYQSRPSVINILRWSYHIDGPALERKLSIARQAFPDS